MVPRPPPGLAVAVVIAIILVIALLLVTAGVWMPNKAPANGVPTSGVPATSAPDQAPLAEEPGARAAIAPLTLRLGHNMVEDSALHAAAARYAREVEARSDGRIRIEVYPASRLGNDLQMIEMAKQGSLDLLLSPTAKLSSDVPAIQFVDLPFYYDSRATLYAILDGEPGQMLLDKLRPVGLVGVTFWGNGFKQFTANSPLRTPEDFHDLRFRVMKSRIIIQQFRLLGATPVPIEFNATYQALADGAVDGQENPLVAIVGMRFYEVQSHLTLSHHGYLAYVLSISAKVFDQLPDSARTLLIAVAEEVTQWEREETQRRDADYLERVKAAGVTVTTLTAAERERFVKALAVIPQRFETLIGADLHAAIEDMRADRENANTGSASGSTSAGTSAGTSGNRNTTPVD
ncbi:TRAP transporter substrate-binding protein [Thiorhodovibrio frisius]|uniref:Tripartite ATP-independent periplasmic transporter solute receptor, DctP family n=1 Tax=Thiorhodovibrio frisius TaxID=631362 RepID=H8YYP5_9GAMM|nr:TRAP transporter substrate-binding protein [Thiorhodovibrio frisius]EIC23571.1 tripartite ATP-independent periplasmic transporter solute receptor, DctP family [Thiorhodovibrio frisius]WPL23342.1 C4-dicarboxylate-binding periplasmic protein precursor [Thiorhodovibrio frisius]